MDDLLNEKNVKKLEKRKVNYSQSCVIYDVNAIF